MQKRDTSGICFLYQSKESDTILKNFTREPLEEMGRNLKKKKTILALGNLRTIVLFQPFGNAREPMSFFTFPSDGKEPSFFSNLSAMAENQCPFSLSPMMAENRRPFPTFWQWRRTNILFHFPGKDRESDTMLKNFTREPPEKMGRNLKKKKTILALGNLTAWRETDRTQETEGSGQGKWELGLRLFLVREPREGEGESNASQREEEVLRLGQPRIRWRESRTKAENSVFLGSLDSSRRAARFDYKFVKFGDRLVI
ncbi:hypothetical protein M5K25_008748 [Dendrobium thyrsiflorum]|uniref:Uncharacterized protein n=1 Tax=Dendrobium thyrsiflorum TaxID=117978 RepID=A0ABD0V9J1_DENTH